jgi:hypothetical protein
VRRREFIALLGGAAAMPMMTAGAQERMRRIGILTASFGVDDPEMQTRKSAFILALREFGWAEGKICGPNSVRVEARLATFVSTRPNWSRSSTSFWPMGAKP